MKEFAKSAGDDLIELARYQQHTVALVFCLRPNRCEGDKSIGAQKNGRRVVENEAVLVQVSYTGPTGTSYECRPGRTLLVIYDGCLL